MTQTDVDVPEKSLEYWLSRATDPFLPETCRSDFVKGFCEQVNQELEGHIVACRLLAHKIQSPHEKEALNALNVLESCVRNCGQRLHNEIAKFRFLNEMIKILSPKYLGNQTSENVKRRAIELIYSWKISLRHLPKIKQAYDMLKEQNIITLDPVYMNEQICETPPPAPKPKLATFEDEEKAKLLSQLLKSKNAEDLQAANRLIKSMVKAEDQRIEKVSKRGSDLDTASNNARLLSEMVSQFDKNSTIQQEIEIMKDLMESLQKLRPSLFRYAGEAAEGDEQILAEILAVNDEVGKAVEDFRTKVEPEILAVMSRKSSAIPANVKAASGGSSLLDLDTQISDFGNNLHNRHPALKTFDILSNSSSECSLVGGDDVLMIGGGGTPLNIRKTSSNAQTSAVNELHDIFGGAGTTGALPSSSTTYRKPSLSSSVASNSEIAGASNAQQQAKPKGWLDLDALSQALIQKNLPTGLTSANQIQQNKKMSLRDLNQQSVAEKSSSPSCPMPTSSFSPLDPFGGSLAVVTSVPNITPIIKTSDSHVTSSTASQAPLSHVTTSGTAPSGPPGPSSSSSSGGGALLKGAGGPIMASSLTVSGLRPVPTTPHPTPEVSMAGSPVSDSDLISAAVAKMASQNLNIDDLCVPLEAIKPSSKPPLVVLDRDQLKIVLHYAANKPRFDVLTTVISVSSSRDQQLTDTRFTVRLRDPVNCSFKLQTATGNSLPPFNPIFPPTAITQILLLASNSASLESIPIEYTFIYKAAEQNYSISGLLDIDFNR